MLKQLCFTLVMVIAIGSLSGCDLLWFGAGAGGGYYVGSHEKSN